MRELPDAPDKLVRIGLRQQVLLAALECCGGDLEKIFTAEDLLLAAWARDKAEWGLRGHEKEHPDSEKIYKELDRVSVKGKNVRGGLVGLGLLERIRQRTYRLTTAGLALASQGPGVDPSIRGTAERALADAISAIMSHSVFQDWIRDPNTPKHFRDAGHFWGVAPGTPPGVVRSRILRIDKTLDDARCILDRKGVDEISGKGGKALFERSDLERAFEFHTTLKERFKKDLKVLQVDMTGLGN
jgi:hypothetical protein